MVTLYSKLIDRFYNTSFYVVIDKLYFKFKNKFKITNENIRHFDSWSFRIKKISYIYINKDDYSFKLFEESEKIIKEINLISKDLKNKENIANFELIDKFFVNLRKLNEINKKFEKHTKKF